MRHRYENVVLGFTESATEETNEAEQFASKAGGKAVWLYRTKPAVRPRCSSCGMGEMFLCQVYAPIDTDAVDHDEAFHRTLYVTICSNNRCTNGGDGVSVLRGQLARENEFYLYSVDDVDMTESGNKCDEELKESCDVCGFHGDLVCTGCKSESEQEDEEKKRERRYCSRQCQKEDWKMGHKWTCAGGGKEKEKEKEKDKMKIEDENVERIWRKTELEIFTDRHRTPPSSDDEDEEEEEEEEEEEWDCEEKAASRKTEERNAKSERMMEEEMRGAGATMQDASAEELPEELFEKGMTKTKAQRRNERAQGRYKRIIGYEANQVVRYDRGGTPIWPAHDGQVSDDEVPNCERCGSKRMFEMQIMSQVVYLMYNEYEEERKESSTSRDRDRKRMKELALRLRNDMDWATIVVFSCEKSCVTPKNEYQREFAYVQRFRI